MACNNGSYILCHFRRPCLPRFRLTPLAVAPVGHEPAGLLSFVAFLGRIFLSSPLPTGHLRIFYTRVFVLLAVMGMWSISSLASTKVHSTTGEIHGFGSSLDRYRCNRSVRPSIRVGDYRGVYTTEKICTGHLGRGIYLDDHCAADDLCHFRRSFLPRFRLTPLAVACGHTPVCSSS